MRERSLLSKGVSGTKTRDFHEADDGLVQLGGSVLRNQLQGAFREMTSVLEALSHDALLEKLHVSGSDDVGRHASRNEANLGEVRFRRLDIILKRLA